MRYLDTLYKISDILESGGFHVLGASLRSEIDRRGTEGMAQVIVTRIQAAIPVTASATETAPETVTAPDPNLDPAIPVSTGADSGMIGSGNAAATGAAGTAPAENETPPQTASQAVDNQFV